jgi:hypothetical protein
MRIHHSVFAAPILPVPSKPALTTELPVPETGTRPLQISVNQSPNCGMTGRIFPLSFNRKIAAFPILQFHAENIR